MTPPKKTPTEAVEPKIPGTAVAPIAPAATSLVPAELAELFQGHEMEGLEGMGSGDKSIPFLAIIQNNSPQRDKQHQKFIDGAEEGMVFNTVTQELYAAETGIRVIPVFFQKTWGKWIPRKEGGGFLGNYADEDCTTVLFEPTRSEPYDGQPDIVETNNHWVLVESTDGTWAPAILALKSTQLSVSRKWNTLMTMAASKYKAPTFARIYRLSTVRQENDKGVFYGFVVGEDGFVSKEQFQQSIDFLGAIKGGLVVVDYSKETTAAPEVTTEPKRDPSAPTF